MLSHISSEALELEFSLPMQMRKIIFNVVSTIQSLIKKQALNFIPETQT